MNSGRVAVRCPWSETINVGLCVPDRGRPVGPGKADRQVWKCDAIDDERLLVGTPDSGMPPTAPSFEALDAEVFTETGHFGGPNSPRGKQARTGRKECEAVHKFRCFCWTASSTRQLPRMSIRGRARWRHHPVCRAARGRAPVTTFTVSGLNKRRTSLRQMPDMAKPTRCRWRRGIAGPMSMRERRRAPSPSLVVHATRKIVRSRPEQGPAFAPIRRCHPS